MSSPLDSFVAAGGTSGNLSAANSRYNGLATTTWARPDGTLVRYLQRRIIPQPTQYTVTRRVNVVDGDRIDRIAAAQIGDPLLFWMICDANGTMDPEDLTSQTGRSIGIPLPAGPGSIPANG